MLAVSVFNRAENNISGTIIIYKFENNDWIEKSRIINNSIKDDYFGYSLALSGDGNRIAVGAKFDDSIKATDVSPVYYSISPEGSFGRVSIYNYKRSFASWQLKWMRSNTITGTTNNEYLGFSVSMNSAGTRLAISSMGNNNIYRDNNGNLAIRYVKIYNYNNTTKKWDQLEQGIKIPNGDDRPVVSLNSGDGNTIAIGYTNVIKVYNRTNSKWYKKGNDIDITNYSGDMKSYYNRPISLSEDGNTLVVGDPYHNNDKGIVKVYKCIYYKYTINLFFGKKINMIGQMWSQI